LGEIVVLIQQSQYTAEMVTPLGWRDNALANIDIAFVNATRTFTVSHAVNSFFEFYEEGIKYTVDNGDPNAEIIIPDTEGLHAIYYDQGVITSDVNPTPGEISVIIRSKPLIAYVTWDATNNEAIYVAQETHQFKLNAYSHALWHFNVGATWQGGLSLGDFVIGDGSLDTHAQFSAESGFLSDEDLFHVILPYGSTEGIDVFYRAGAAGEWRRDSSAGFSVKSFVGGSGRLAWNQFTGGVWQQTEVNDLDYVLCHIFATTLGDLLVQEFFPVATVIFQTRSSYANSVSARVVESDPVAGETYVNWLGTEIGAGTAPSSHLNLTEINGGAEADGGHSVFPKLAGRAGGQTINGGTQINDELTLQDNPVDANSITIEGILDKVDGPLVSTINALPRYETTGGKLLKNSNVTVDDLGNMTIPGTVDGRNVSDDGSKLDGIESGADVTDTDNVTSAGAIMQTLVDVAGDLIVADADNSVVRLPPGSEGWRRRIRTG
jgi:hypothetical protein